MTNPLTFGGNWTEEKLDRLRRYLIEYRRIFTRNKKAQFFKTIYVDAFAGTGSRRQRDALSSDDAQFTDFEEEEARAYLAGSARIALELDEPFDHYVFVERDQEAVQQLESLKRTYPELAERIEVHQADANRFLQTWCDKTDWRDRRAVVFLDPFGMQVDWATIEAIGKTRAIDLWILFPLGIGVNRLLTRSGPPPYEWANALTRIFGTDEWRDAFYGPRAQPYLFGDEHSEEKKASIETIGRFFVSRLKTVFAGVVETPLPLLNSRNSPLYLLCFAAGNERGAPIAIRIASYLLKGAPDGR